MPTTEIISVGAGVGPHTPRLARFAQRCDCRLQSDRGSFQAVLDLLEGTMVHLGDYSDTPNDPCWFCGHVTIHPDPEDRHHIQYESTAFEELLILLAVMQEQSPTRHVIFLTDYQFGPDEFKIEHLDTIGDFSTLNAAGRIRFNTLYHIHQNQSGQVPHFNNSRDHRGIETRANFGIEG